MSRKIQVYTGGSVGCNGYLIEAGDGYVVVDAPMGIADWVARRLPEGARVKHLLLTHQHFDHVEGAAELQRRTGCTIHAVAPYSKALTLELAAASWGLPPVEPYTVDDVLGPTPRKADWGGLAWEVYPIAGHATDGAAYYLPGDDEVFVGDILFAGSVGRTDFPGGSMSALVRGIQEHLMPLPPQTMVNSGHGPSTTIGEEQLNNPYLS
ncbi:MAG: MBL fold metallo-hydrolase [Akkermansia sp.]|nr:MBL fold metallo-hydrolase [Akkermansia sp.]MBR2313280.1 MBL fold metallo-hydrolase [Akkermansia sp.]